VPSKEVLLAQLLGVMKSPITSIAVVMKAVADQKAGAAA
jgi:large subunit ribosomal protein L10